MKLFANVIRNFLKAIIGSYAVSLLLYLLLHFMIGESWHLIGFFNSFAQIMLLPSLLLLPLCLLFRQWRLAAFLLPSVLFFGFTWGALFLPDNSVQAQEDEQAIRVLSYNIGALGQSPEAVLELIRNSDADIVALQELAIPYAEAIETELMELYPYMALHPQLTSTQGQGLLSRFPLSEDSYRQYDFLPNPLGHQRAFIADLGLVVYNLHPTHPGMQGQLFNPSYRSQEIADILERTSSEEHPLILVGDFNMPDLSDDYRAIRTHYQDAFWEVGQGFGWTFSFSKYAHVELLESNNLAFLRLDYLFYSAGIQPLSAEVLTQYTGSDHHPLLFELLLTKRS